MKNRKDYIYVLIEPDKKDSILGVRYVGHTYDPKTRLKGHMYNVRHGEKNPHFIYWVRKLERQGQKPILKVIEECTNTDKALKRERHWEKYYKKKGCDLVNKMKCGLKAPIMFGKDNPFYGKRHPKEIQDIITKKRTGAALPHNKEWDAHVADGLRGKKKSFQHRFNIIKARLLFFKNKNKKYFGIHKNGNGWVATISDIKHDVKKYIGTFKTSKKCALSFDKVCWNLYHDKSILNFPENFK